MSVVVIPEIFLYNAFLSRKEGCLTYKDLAKFANILEDTILKRSREKYVLLQLEDIAIDEFLENDNNFVRGIEKIYCKVIPQKEKVDEINSRYNIDVQKAFKFARILNKS